MLIKSTIVLIKIFIIVCISFLLTQCNSSDENNTNLPLYNSFGLIVDSLTEVHGIIEKNQTLSDILLQHNVSLKKIYEIADTASNIFPVRNFKAGNEYYIYAKWDTAETVKYFVYLKNPIEYVVFDLNDDIKIQQCKKEVEIVKRTVSGSINNSLWETITSLNIEPDVAVKLSEIYAWQIDFFRIQKRDSFKVVYEQLLLHGEPVGVGRILASNFIHRNENFYAFRFEKNDEANFYDEKGNSLRKAFLKAPLKFSRISSRYSNSRLHPILGSVRPHLGTDYAAPSGTEIMTVGDGTIQVANYTRSNGNYVKVRHNSVYTTQYLHMSKFARGIRPGVHVKQGQVIGYVGSTGLATGPHVCFRFWKNGKQVDHLKEKIPSSTPIEAKYKEEYVAVKDSLMNKLTESIEPIKSLNQNNG